MYVKSPRQTLECIYDHVNNPPDHLKAHLPALHELVGRRHKEGIDDDVNFVEWFRRTYPVAYAGMF